MRPCKKTQNRKAGYLVLAGIRGALSETLRTFLRKENILAELVREDFKAREIGRALSRLVKRGAGEIIVLSASRLPKCAAQKDIPLAIEAFRKNRMHLDFHYCGVGSLQAPTKVRGVKR
jgi:glycosyltransferase involved in cell wall biosynthesis